MINDVSMTQIKQSLLIDYNELTIRFIFSDVTPLLRAVVHARRVAVDNVKRY